jgi:hypothetical protein
VQFLSLGISDLISSCSSKLLTLSAISICISSRFKTMF